MQTRPWERHSKCDTSYVLSELHTPHLILLLSLYMYQLSQLLRDKEDETRKCFDAQIVNIERELRGSQTKVERLLINASKDSSQEEWSERIVNSTGVSEGMRCLLITMERTTLTLKSIREARASSDRRTDLVSLAGGLLYRLFPSVTITRKMQVVFVPLDTSHEQICFTVTINVGENSQLKALRASFVEMARKHYGYDENELKEEDVQLTDVFRQKVSIGILTSCYYSNTNLYLHSFH